MRVFDEEAAGERGVGIEGDIELSEEEEERFVVVTSDGVVFSLVDGGEDIVLGLCVVVDPPYVLRREIGQTELGDL